MEAISHILIWGSIVSLVLFSLVIISYLIDPKIFGADLNWPKEHQNRTGGLIIALIILVISITIMVYASFAYEQLKPKVGFGTALLVNYFIFQIFNLADLIILDWFIYMKLKPRFMRPANFPVADNLSKHIKGFVMGMFVGFVPALVSTSIWGFCF